MIHPPLLKLKWKMYLRSFMHVVWSSWTSEFTDDTDCMVNCKSMTCRKRRECKYSNGEKTLDNKSVHRRLFLPVSKAPV